MRKIAILILAHKNENQLCRLINKLGNTYFDFFVHIDSKVDILPFETKLKELPFAVNIVSERIDTQLIDFSLIDATMKVVKCANHQQQKYLYYVLLTGQDYPIKTSKEIYNSLYDNYPKCFIDLYGCEESFHRGVLWTKDIGVSYYSQKIRKILRGIVGDKFYYSSYGKIVKVIAVLYDCFMSYIKYSPRKAIKQLSYHYSAGSHFWMLPDVAIDYIENIYYNDVCLNDIFHHITAPEESYFQTILSNYPSLIINDPYIQFESPNNMMDNESSLRLIKWYVNGVHTSGHPAIWRKDDWDYMRSCKSLFARKFDEKVDDEILKIIDSEICE